MKLRFVHHYGRIFEDELEEEYGVRRSFQLLEKFGNNTSFRL